MPATEELRARIADLERALTEYIIRYGMTDAARRVMMSAESSDFLPDPPPSGRRSENRCGEGGLASGSRRSDWYSDED